MIMETSKEKVLAVFPEANESFFALTGAWRIYPNSRGDVLPIGVSMFLDRAWDEAAISVEYKVARRRAPVPSPFGSRKP